MTNVERVQKMLSTDDGRTKFLEWLSNEVTQAMIAAARELARPKPPATPVDASSILFSHGACVGANDIVDFISSPLVAVGTGERLREPIPDYGSRKIMESAENG